MSCQVKVSSHWFDQGREATFGPNDTKLWEHNWNDDIDAYQLTGDCSNTLVSMYVNSPGEGDNVFPANPYKTFLGWNQNGAGWGEHRWFKNKISYIRFTPVPQKDYWTDMDITGNIGDHWLRFGDVSGKQSGHNDDPTSQGNFCIYGGVNTAWGEGCTRGEPCPGGEMHLVNSRKARCYYKNSNEIQDLHTRISGSDSEDPRKNMWSTIARQFCEKPENLLGNPGGQTCLERDTGSRIAKEYCKVGDRIKSDGVCTKENLGNFYTELAEAFCKTTTGKADSWCSCYNVMNGACDTDSGAAGCVKKKQTFDKLVEATPQEYKNSWSQMEPCFGGVCQGNVFQPAGYNANCNRSVQVCVQDFDIQSIADSQINATCNLTSNRDTQPSAGDGSGGGGSGGSGGSGGGGIDDYIPRSIDELKTDSKKQMAVGGVGALFLVCCLLLIVVLASSGGSGGGGGPMRFRR